MLAAPTIVGELSTCSRSVRLQGQFTGADVEIVIGGSIIALGQAQWPDQRFPFPPGIVLNKGAVVRARQRHAGQESSLSKDGATVQEVRPGLPPPVVDAPFVGCASLLVVHGLSPDATVTVRDGANVVIGTEQAAGSRAVVTLAHPVGFAQTVGVTADACGSVTSVTSPPSEPIAPFTGKLPTPTLPQHPYACQRILEVANLRPGETLILERGDGTQARYQVSMSTLLARLTPRLDPGEAIRLSAETSQACDVPASDILSIAVDAGPPPAPLVSTPPCPGSPVIRLDGLIPSATVRLRRGAEELLTLEAAESSQLVDLAGTALNSGDHLVAEQALCDVWSPPSPVDAVVTVPDVTAGPHIVEPAAECSTVVRVTGVAPGSLISVFSMLAGGRIGHELANGDTVDVEVAPPLIETDTIVAVSEGCAAGYDSATVVAVPDSTPVISRAVEGDLAVDVGSCRPGATIDVRVGPLWAGSAVAVGYDVRVYVRDPLPGGVAVQATARYCGKTVVGQTRDVERRRRPTFSRVSTKGISVGTGHFHSGRVEAIAPLSGNRALLGTEASGLWLMQPGMDAVSLSHDWPDPHIRCLTRDPTTPGRWFAGTGSELRSSVPSAPQPERTWIVVPGWSHGAVNDVLVVPGLPGPPTLVAATDSGVWWGPLAGLTFGTDPVVNAGRYTALALGPNGSVVAYRAGTGAADGRIHVGSWGGAGLTWTNRTFATPPGGTAG